MDRNGLEMSGENALQSEAAFQPVEALRICREEVKHEQVVLGNRLNSYITSQAFLVSAFAVSMNNTSVPWAPTFKLFFPLLLSVSGLLLSGQAYPGIVGSITIIDRWHDRQRELLEAHAEVRQYYLEHRSDIQATYRRSKVFAKVAPWIFGTSWIVFGSLAAWMHSMR